jgi:hypothetical protein
LSGPPGRAGGIDIFFPLPFFSQIPRPTLGAGSKLKSHRIRNLNFHLNYAAKIRKRAAEVAGLLTAQDRILSVLLLFNLNFQNRLKTNFPDHSPVFIFTNSDRHGCTVVGCPYGEH